jgi:3-deoxy-D-manno-octulosonic-acid transferase
MGLQREPIDTGLLGKAYEVATTCAVPLVSVGLLAFQRGRRRYEERLGDWGDLPPIGWWMHGASVGEVQGLLPFIQKVRDTMSGDRILLSATSPTGLDRGAAAADLTRLVPLDAPWVVARALRKLSFDRFVVCETEFWPTLFKAVLRRGVPCHIINGRVSDYTISRYMGMRGLFSPILRGFVSVSVPDDEQRLRFLELGVEASRIHVTGHTKYDVAPRYAGDEARNEARHEFFPGVSAETPILVLGSIRPGEDKLWFAALERVWSEGRRCKVVVAPRHAEKFSFFWEELQRVSKSAVRRSLGPAMAGRDVDILLLDTMGELERAYAAADLAFIGATLVDIGGHNPLEAAMYGVPVVIGPHHSVIRELAREMRNRSGILEVRDVESIYRLVIRLCDGDPGLREIGAAGQVVSQLHQGSSVRALSVINESEEYQCHSS